MKTIYSSILFLFITSCNTKQAETLKWTEEEKDLTYKECITYTMDILEMNEAFAAQTLACTRKMGVADNDPRINPNGGAIAIGHPLGMTGARILNSAAIQLQETNSKYALVNMCIGVGQGYATILERV